MNFTCDIGMIFAPNLKLVVALGLLAIAPTAFGTPVSGYVGGEFKSLSAGGLVDSVTPFGTRATFSSGAITFFGTDVIFVSPSGTADLKFLLYNIGTDPDDNPGHTGVLDLTFNDGLLPIGNIVTVGFTLDFETGAGDFDRFDLQLATPSASSFEHDGRLYHWELDDGRYTGAILEGGTAEVVWTVDYRVTSFAPVPEPSTYGCLGAGALFGLLAWRRWRARG